jgi:hypothetical protein
MLYSTPVFPIGLNKPPATGNNLLKPPTFLITCNDLVDVYSEPSLQAVTVSSTDLYIQFNIIGAVWVIPCVII